jgi:large subunit ribosomal protein L15
VEKKAQKKKILKPQAPKPRVKKVKALPAKTGLKLVGLHNLTVPRGAHKPKKLLGRGPSSGHGKTSTRGSKGQTSRAGRHFYLGFEGGQSPLIRRMPKRGFTSRFKKEYQIINLSALNKIKEEDINLDLLEAKGLIKDKSKLVKILGDGEIKNPRQIQAHAFSKSAAEKIQKSGGKIEIIHVPS